MSVGWNTPVAAGRRVRPGFDPSSGRALRTKGSPRIGQRPEVDLHYATRSASNPRHPAMRCREVRSSTPTRAVSVPTGVLHLRALSNQSRTGGPPLRSCGTDYSYQTPQLQACTSSGGGVHVQESDSTNLGARQEAHGVVNVLVESVRIAGFIASDGRSRPL